MYLRLYLSRFRKHNKAACTGVSDSHGTEFCFIVAPPSTISTALWEILDVQIKWEKNLEIILQRVYITLS